jgi:hypothetical protein
MLVTITLINWRNCEIMHKLMAGKHMSEIPVIRGRKIKPSWNFTDYGYLSNLQNSTAETFTLKFKLTWVTLSVSQAP